MTQPPRKNNRTSRPQGGRRKLFFRELLDKIHLVESGQEPLTAQPELISWFGWDTGSKKDKAGRSKKSRSHGFPVHVRYALTVVCHYLIIHHGDDARSGFVQELKERSNFCEKTIRDYYPYGHFDGFYPGTLLSVLHLPLSHKKVRMALQRAIRENFVTNTASGTIELDKIDKAKVCDIVGDALAAKSDQVKVKHPGLWMTLQQRKIESQAPQERTRLIYAPTCKKGGGRVK